VSSKVFISYRRDDSAGHAGRVYDRLEREFGRDLLFMDVDAIPLGVNFIKVLRNEVAKCDVLLAVIGPNWLNVGDEQGHRRLDNPSDFVRIEIGTALQRDIPVIPILLDGAKIPRAEQLPDDIQELAVRNGLDVRNASFHIDMDKLIRALKGMPSREHRRPAEVEAPKALEQKAEPREPDAKLPSTEEELLRRLQEQTRRVAEEQRLRQEQDAQRPSERSGKRQPAEADARRPAERAPVSARPAARSSPRMQDPPGDVEKPIVPAAGVAAEVRPIPAYLRHGRVQADAPAERPAARSFVKPVVAILVVAILGPLLIWQWPNVMALYWPPTVDAGGGGQPAPAPAAPSAAVAQRVVLYEDDSSDPQGKRFVGSVIWRTEAVPPSPGQPAELVVRADLEIPERRIAMTWSLRRNTDPSLPATHTVEVMFRLPADFPAGGISDVSGVILKESEQAKGVALAGLGVKVTTNFFLIGLSVVPAEKDRNMQLLKQRPWFDIPIVYSNNRRAVIAMEKGPPGDRAFQEAFAAWDAAQPATTTKK
jgi:hypothetical protein